MARPRNSQQDDPTGDLAAPVKRPVGRPKKVTADVPKRPVGRPRKTPITDLSQLPTRPNANLMRVAARFRRSTAGDSPSAQIQDVLVNGLRLLQVEDLTPSAVLRILGICLDEVEVSLRGPLGQSSSAEICTAPKQPTSIQSAPHVGSEVVLNCTPRK